MFPDGIRRRYLSESVTRVTSVPTRESKLEYSVYGYGNWYKTTEQISIKLCTHM